MDDSTALTIATDGEPAAERARRESEGRFHALAELSPDAVWVMLDGRCVYANTAAARLMRAAPPTALLGLTLHEMALPEDHALVDERIARVLAHGVVDELAAIRFRRRDGTVVDVETSAARVQWEGRPAVQVVFRDVAARRRAEATFRASEARLRLALDLAELGTWSIDLADGSGHLDARAAQIVGLPAGDFADVVERQAAGTHPDDLAPMQAAVAAGIASGEPFELAYRVVHPDGSIRHVASRARVEHDDAGRAVRLVGTNRDVTAEREVAADRERLLAETEAARAAADLARRRLETVLEHLPVGVTLAEAPSGKLLVSNAAVRRIWGLDTPAARVAEYSHLYIGYRPGAGPEAARQYASDQWPLARALTRGEVVLDEVIEIEHPDGARRLVSISAAPVCDGDERIVGGVVMSLDVTERERLLGAERAARAEAEAARREAEAANRAKSEFLAVMSHELRTPLNAIGGYAELMEMGIRGPLTEQQRDDLQRIHASQRHLLGLINEVLNYAKLETGSVRYDVTAVRVRDALAGAEALVAPQAHAKGIELAIGELPSDLVVRADPEKLRQILVNLLSNAVKFTGRGGHIELAAEGDAAGAVTRVRVRDSGIGIPAHKLEAIFEPFVQVRAELTRTAEGTGLGLAISRDLARGMGGDLVVESTLGEGSTFTLVLPSA